MKIGDLVILHHAKEDGRQHGIVIEHYFHNIWWVLWIDTPNLLRTHCDEEYWRSQGTVVEI